MKLAVRNLKIKSAAALRGHLCHNQREHERQANIDPERFHLNTLQAETVQNTMDRYYARVPPHRRGASVLAVETIVTAKLEFFEGLTPEKEAEFFQTAIRTLTEKYLSLIHI